jgi:hypothetical protein
MPWLAENWTSLALGAVLILMMTRMGCCGMAHRHPAKQPAPGSRGNADAIRTPSTDQNRKPEGHGRHGCC